MASRSVARAELENPKVCARNSSGSSVRPESEVSKGNKNRNKVKQGTLECDLDLVGMWEPSVNQSKRLYH